MQPFMTTHKNTQFSKIFVESIEFKKIFWILEGVIL